MEDFFYRKYKFSRKYKSCRTIILSEKATTILTIFVKRATCLLLLISKSRNEADVGLKGV